MIVLVIGFWAYVFFDTRLRAQVLEGWNIIGPLVFLIACIGMSPNLFFSFRVDDTGFELTPFPFLRYAATWEEVESYKVEPMYIHGTTIPLMSFYLKRSKRRIQVRFPSVPDSDQRHRLAEMYAFAARRIDGGADNLFNGL